MEKYLLMTSTAWPVHLAFLWHHQPSNGIPYSELGHLTSIIVMGSYCCGKIQWPQATQGGKGLCYLRAYIPSSRGMRADTQLGNMEVGTNTEAMYKGVLLTVLLPGACSACFIMTPMINSLGWCHTQWAGLSNINHSSRKCTIDLPTGQSGGNIFSVEVLSSKMTVVYVKLT